jgi:hypothetical protein
VTLVMALVCMSAWLSSLRSAEYFSIPFTVRYAWMFACCDSHFSISEIRDLHDDNDLSGNIDPFIALRYLLSERDDMIQPIAGRRFTCYHNTIAKYRFRGVLFPCWSLVIPLTLLSAILLISKPRPKRKPVNFVDQVT